MLAVSMKPQLESTAKVFGASMLHYYMTLFTLAKLSFRRLIELSECIELLGQSSLVLLDILVVNYQDVLK